MSNIFDKTETVQDAGVFVDENQPAQEENKGLGLGGYLKELFTIPRGSDTMEQYKENPLNFDKSEETGIFLRGVDGLVGSLNSALVDIIVGIYRIFRKKRG